jgi:hypothetical protein
MNGLARILKPIDNGWVIRLPDGRELARFTGPNAKQRALRYVVTHDIANELRRESQHGGNGSATPTG